MLIALLGRPEVLRQLIHNRFKIVGTQNCIFSMPLRSHEFQLAISTFHAQPFPLPNCCRAIDLPISLQQLKQYGG
jgi:hypothetical protein